MKRVRRETFIKLLKESRIRMARNNRRKRNFLFHRDLVCKLREGTPYRKGWKDPFCLFSLILIGKCICYLQNKTKIDSTRGNSNLINHIRANTITPLHMIPSKGSVFHRTAQLHLHPVVHCPDDHRPRCSLPIPVKAALAVGKKS